MQSVIRITLIEVLIALAFIQFGSAFASTDKYYVSSSGSDSNSGSSSSPFRTIQKAVDSATAGDTIELRSGTYDQSFETVRSGTSSNPITITGPSNAVLRGSTNNICGTSCVARIEHDHIHMEGFTIDGKKGSFYQRTLVSVLGQGGWQNNLPFDGVKGTRISNMTVKNSWYVCVSLRWYAEDSVIEDSTIENCGQNPSSNVGEGVYIGTDAQTLNNSNPGKGFDYGKNNIVRNNTIDVNGGSECIEVKPRNMGNVITGNTCSGTASGGVGIRLKGGSNTVENNIVRDMQAGNDRGISFGGATYQDLDDGSGTVQVGLNNKVRNNTIGPNVDYGIDVRILPQDEVCGTTFNGISSSRELVPSNLSGAPSQASVDTALGSPTKTCSVSTNNSGGSSSSDTTAPTVSITSPLNNSIVQDSIFINANANDNDSLDRVEFYLDGAFLSAGPHNPQYVAPYSFNYDTSVLGDSTYSLSAIAFDSSGNQSSVDQISITTSNGNQSGNEQAQTFEQNESEVPANDPIAAGDYSADEVQFIPVDTEKDTDNDGVADIIDEDDDNDGIPDTEDEDDDNDGIPDTEDEDYTAVLPPFDSSSGGSDTGLSSKLPKSETDGSESSLSLSISTPEFIGIGAVIVGITGFSLARHSSYIGHKILMWRINRHLH